MVSRIVVKVGTSTLTNEQGRIDRAFIADLTAQLATLNQQNCDVLLVTSGAIRAGKDLLNARDRDRSPSKNIRKSPPFDTLPYKQAAAAIGQGVLIHTYTEAFAWRSVDCAQVLLTRDDLSDRKRFLNARNTLQALLSLGVIPIINENDTVAVDEIKFGDNDTLAALVATLVEADLLLILSDVEGLYDRPPGLKSSGESLANLIPNVTHIDTEIERLAGDSISGVGTGGMATKINAAKVATTAGIKTVIARGRRERVILDVASDLPIGTTFSPCPGADRMSSRKQWLAHGARSKGYVCVNSRAESTLRENGVSLLAVGITSVEGGFSAGDLIEIRNEANLVFAKGLTNYPDGELRRIQGLKSDELEATLGYKGFEEVVHRDNLVLEN